MKDSEDMGLCNCKVRKTRSYIEQNKNVCPTCGKPLMVEHDYSNIDELKDDEEDLEQEIRKKIEELVLDK